MNCQPAPLHVGIVALSAREGSGTSAPLNASARPTDLAPDAAFSASGAVADGVAFAAAAYRSAEDHTFGSGAYISRSLLITGMPLWAGLAAGYAGVVCAAALAAAARRALTAPRRQGRCRLNTSG